MQSKALAVSIVIPVFNEENHLKDCLDAIEKQTVKPLEVIVVDNNSTDKSTEIARSYKFVTLIKELKQGRAHARNAGFNKAKGDIIGRIDADSQLDVNWVEVAQRVFANDTIAAITGIGRTNISLLPRIPTIYSTLWSRVYYWNVHYYFGTVTMWGANMAVRKSAWQKIKDKACLDDGLVHEDEDISLLISAIGGKIIQVNDLVMRARKQSYHYFPKFCKYMKLAKKTKKYHQAKGTFSATNFTKINLLRALPGFLASIIIGTPYVISSFLHWPLDSFMIYYRNKTGRKWLD